MKRFLISLIFVTITTPLFSQWTISQDWYDNIFFEVIQDDAPSYDADAVAIFEAFTTPPTDARKTLINNFVVSYKAAGLWTKRDAIWVMAAATQQAGQINWKNPATFTLTLVNSPTFTVDEGFTGNGTTMYINTNWNPAGSSLFLQNDANISAYTRSTGTGSGVLLGCAGVNINMITFLPKFTDNNLYNRMNNANAILYTITTHTDWQGSYSINRTSSTAVEIFRNGATLGSQSKTSDGRTTRNLYFLCYNNNGTAQTFTSKQISIVAVGGSLTAQEMADENTIFETYLDALGKGIIP